MLNLEEIDFFGLQTGYLKESTKGLVPSYILQWGHNLM